MFINKNKITILMAFTINFFTLNTSFAIHSTVKDAEQLKNKIIYNERLTYKTTTKTIILPVSRGFDQKETCLCWSYAFFNALETLYLINHPDLKLEISRGAMQYINLQDRIDLKIDGIEDHLNPEVYKRCWAEGGTPLSAAYLLKNYGALPYDEYHDVISPPNYTNLYYSIFVDNTTPKQKRALTDSLLPLYFGYDIPETTHFNGQTLSRLDFALQILPQGTWNTYAIAKDGKEHIGNGLDPDARRSEQTHFIVRDKLIHKINQSLMNNRPVIYSNNLHVILIYGADYDNRYQPINFYIKDTYPDYFYKADFEKVMDNMMEITILEDN
ncbi:hypothetical protein [Legionella busanensis]|nr:hypothetical protein [Legionella busanensis]